MANWARGAALATGMALFSMPALAFDPWFFTTETDQDGTEYGFAQTATIDGNAWLFAECAPGEAPILALFLDASAGTIASLDAEKTSLTLTNGGGAEVSGVATYRKAGEGLLGITMDDETVFAPALALFSEAQWHVSAGVAPSRADLPGTIRFPARGSSEAVAGLRAFCNSLE